jgi:hypothetical protein
MELKAMAGNCWLLSGIMADRTFGGDIKTNLSFALAPAFGLALFLGAPQRTNSQSTNAESPLIVILGSRMSKSQKSEKRSGLSSLGKGGFSDPPAASFLSDELSNSCDQNFSRVYVKCIVVLTCSPKLVPPEV